MNVWHFILTCACQVPLCSVTPLPVLLTLLECSQQVHFLKHVEHHLQFALDPLHSVKTMTLEA